MCIRDRSHVNHFQCIEIFPDKILSSLIKLQACNRSMPLMSLMLTPSVLTFSNLVSHTLMKVRMPVPLVLVIFDNTHKCSSISDAPFLLLPTLSPTVFSKCSFQGWFQGMESRRRSPWIFGSTPLSLAHLLKSVLYFGNSYILLGNLGGNGNKQAREGQDW